MKKILALIVLSIAMVSCYEDYIKDYTYTGVYFPYQVDVRTFVVGEGMKIDVGAGLGGVRQMTETGMSASSLTILLLHLLCLQK
jgi:hypothetical protein